MNPSPTQLAQENRILTILAALNFVHIVDFMIMMPLGNRLIPYFNISTQQFTFLVSVYAIAAGITSLVSAFYVNNYDRKKILILGFGGFLAGTLACGFAPTYEILLISRTVAGLFGGLIGSQVVSIVADTVPFERRGKAMGIVMGAFAIASIAGVPLSIYLANKISWHAPFIALSAIGLLLVPLILRIIPSLTSHIGTSKYGFDKAVITSIFNDRNQFIALVFSGLMMMGHFMIIPFINPFLEFNLGYSRDFAPNVYLVGGIAALIASRVLGQMADKFGKWRIYTICVLLSLPLVYTITHMTQLPQWAVLSLFAIWFAFATGRGLSAQALVSNVAPLETRGSYQSFVGFINQMGTGLASIIAGIVVTKMQDGTLHGYGSLGWLSIGVLVLTIITGWMIFGKKSEA
jgi:MFS transporter, DHA1 family, inner membrane transport protein